MATVASAAAGGPGSLPELGAVYWRPLVDEQRLRHTGALWTLTTIAHTVPFIGAAVLLALLKPVTIPVGLVLLVHAWVIPELYAARGANVVRARRGRREAGAESVAVGFLADMLGNRARDLHRRTGLVIERGRLGLWVLGEAGALLVRVGGHRGGPWTRVHCYCVGVPEAGLPAADRVAHLLLALREHEEGFATVANQAFAGAAWRVRRRLPREAREALAEALAEARRG